MNQSLSQSLTVRERLFAAVADKDVDLGALRNLLKIATAADVNYQDKNGYTVLRKALRCLSDVFKMVLAHPEIDVNLQNRKNGRTVLINAADANLPDAAEALLNHPAIDVDMVDNEGRTALIAASALCRKTIVYALLAHGVKDLNWQDKDGNTALMLSASNKSYSSIVCALLEQPGIDVNVQNKNGDTALILAPSGNIVEMLLAHSNVLVNLANKDGNTALIQASSNGQDPKGRLEKVKILLNCADINVNMQNKKQETALIVASWEGLGDIVKLLLLHPGVHVNKQRKDKVTALAVAAQKGYVEIVSMLLEREDIDVNLQDEAFEGTALMNALSDGHLGVVQLLLERKDIDVNARNKDGNTALIIACLKGQNVIVQMLLAHEGIDTSVENQRNGTALSCAVAKRHTEIVEMLRTFDHAYKAFPSVQDVPPPELPAPVAEDAALYEEEEQELLLGVPVPEQIPCATEFTSVTDLPTDAQKDEPEENNSPSPASIKSNTTTESNLYEESPALLPPMTLRERLFAAVVDKDVDLKVLRSLLKEATSADVNYQDKNGDTVLRKASLGSVDVLKMVLAHPAIDVNTQNRKDGRTALINASTANRPKAVNALLAHPTIDVNLVDKKGRTALIAASSAGLNAVVEALVGHASIDLNSQDKDGDTALMCASRNDRFGVVYMLLKQPCINLNAQNKNGYTASMMAYSEDIKKLVDDAIDIVNDVNTDGCTALIQAASKEDNAGHEVVIPTVATDLPIADAQKDEPEAKENNSPSPASNSTETSLEPTRESVSTLEDDVTTLQHMQLLEFKKWYENINDKLTRMLEKQEELGDQVSKGNEKVSTMLRTLIVSRHDIPTYAIILPVVASSWSDRANPMRLVRNQYRLYFLCSHTHQIAPCGPEKRGYLITVTKQWVRDAAPVLMVGLIALKLALMSGGIPLPIPDLSPLLDSRELHYKFLDAALHLIKIPPDDATEAHFALDRAIDALDSVGMKDILNAQQERGVSFEAGSREAYQAIKEIDAKENLNIAQTCGLSLIIDPDTDEPAWVLEKNEAVCQEHQPLVPDVHVRRQSNPVLPAQSVDDTVSTECKCVIS